jgi:hypothetical protein
MKRLLSVLIPLLVLTGCTTVHNSRLLNRISIGMTKPEVIGVMGQPDSVAAQSGVEYLRYDLYPPPPYWEAARKEAYFVRIVNGKVESYGRMGDFDSSKDPGMRVILEKR